MSKEIELVVQALQALVGLRRGAAELLLGAPHIDESFDALPCPSEPVHAASALSVAAVVDGRSYRDSGERHEVRLDPQTGAASWRTIATDGAASAWSALPHAVSYHTRRAGHALPAPPFDMVAAGCGRVVAKVRGRSQFFFTFLSPMFRTSDGTMVPSSYFKLDPEVGRPDAVSADLLAHLPTRLGVAQVHPAAIRFPLFRALLATEAAGLMVVNQDQRPRTWHELDFRPPADGVDPPEGAGAPPSARLISYRQADSSVRHDKAGYRLHRVLGIGVGHEHWHEQTSPIYGGEMDSLEGPGLPPVLMERDVYRFFNGPVTDQGGFIDGTGNYYVLAQLVSDQTLRAGPRSDAYAVFWADEQAVFTERWRWLNPADSEFGAFRDVVPSALVQYLARTPWYHSLAFDVAKFWCPCRAMHIGPHSRMAVQRQVVILSGFDPQARAHRLYSIHWSFGTADRTWRWRALPALPGTTAQPPATVSQAVPPYESFGLREDMTLYIVHAHGGQRRVWFQRYLPADQAQAPDGEGLKLPKAQRRPRPATSAQSATLIAKMIQRSEAVVAPNGPMPAEGYSHPWQSLPEDTWLELHQRFSHMGCLMPVVDGRCQYYLLDAPADSPPRGLPLGEALHETSQALMIKTPTFNWDALNQVLADDAITPHLQRVGQWLKTWRKQQAALLSLVQRLEGSLKKASDALDAARGELKQRIRVALGAMDNQREAARDAVSDAVVDQALPLLRDDGLYRRLPDDARDAAESGLRSALNKVLDAATFEPLWSAVKTVVAADDADVNALSARLQALPANAANAETVREALVSHLRRALNAALANGASIRPSFVISVPVPQVLPGMPSRIEHGFDLPRLDLKIGPMRDAVLQSVVASTSFLGKSTWLASQLQEGIEALNTLNRLAGELASARLQRDAERAPQGAYRALVDALEQLVSHAPLVRAERRTPLFSDRFTLMALHRPPLGTILVHWDKRDDDLQAFAPFGQAGSALAAGRVPVQLRAADGSGSVLRVDIRSWHACPAPPCVPEATVRIDDTGGTSLKRMVIAFFSPHSGVRLAENLWRVWLAALPRDATGRFGPAPDVLCQLLRHEAFRPDPTAAGWHRCEIDLPAGSALRSKAEQYCSSAGRDRHGTCLWFESVVGHPAAPDRLRFLA